MIQNMIKEGKIVPSEVTIKLLQRAMLESANNKFLIDGFPRNEENRAAFEEVVRLHFFPYKLLKNIFFNPVFFNINDSFLFFLCYFGLRVCKMLDCFLLLQTKIVPEFVLFFDCSEEEMEKRLLNRNQVAKQNFLLIIWPYYTSFF